MADNYYDLLGVNRQATSDEIKKAFRVKAHQFHPDKSTGDADKFKQVNEAYQVLIDPQKRQQYDQFGQTYDQMRRNGGGGPGPGAGDFGQTSWQNVNMDFGDLGDMFGDLFGFGSQRRPSATPSRGQSIQASIRIPFRTSIFGGTESFQLKHQIVCSHCNGSGAQGSGGLSNCSTCQGSGQVQRTQRTILGSFASVEACPTCQGDGKVIKHPCSPCHGQGRVATTESITVKIPAGIAEGQRIKLSGKGEAGRRGVPPGDLLLEVSVLPDQTFTRHEDEILSAVTIPLTTAALSGQVEVATIDGAVQLKIPAGTVSGKVFILKGRGVPHLRGRGRGDQRVTVQVEIPTRLSAKAKKLLSELRQEGV